LQNCQCTPQYPYPSLGMYCNTKLLAQRKSVAYFQYYMHNVMQLIKFNYVDSSNLSNIDILKINSREVTFHWSRTHQSDNAMCSVSHYELTAINCGRCPNVTSRLDTQVTCTDISTDGRLCTFSVQAIGTFNGSQTASITVFLKGKITCNYATKLILNETICELSSRYTQSQCYVLSDS
jgi:hypothetical protein